jgi:hypothetical protein
MLQKTFFEKWILTLRGFNAPGIAAASFSRSGWKPALGEIQRKARPDKAVRNETVLVRGRPNKK